MHSLSERQPIEQGGFREEDRMLHKKARYADWRFTYPADLFTNVPPARSNVPAMPNSAPPKT